MPITLNQLFTFLAVARTGSVTAAAEQLVVTQPSVSAALSALSRELGVELTEKVGRTIRLTPAGEAYAQYAGAVLGLLDQGQRAASEAAGAAERQVRVAAVTTAAEYLVPRVMQEFHAIHPDVELTLEVGNRERVFQLILDHVADVAVGGSPPSDGRLAGRPFLANEIVLIVAPGDELAERRSVSWEDAAERTWLLREEGSGTRALVESLLAEHDVRPSTLTLGSNGAIKHAVRIGLGVSLQSRTAVELELESGLLATAGLRELPTRHWHVLWSATGPLREPVQAFLAFVQNEFAAHAARKA
jgi:LysR family transcriptional regulator, low CO2-responsive transcriptional regulator